MIKYFDVHSHLNATQFDADREEVIQRLIETATIVVGTNLENSKTAIALAERYENIYACIGIHPVDDPQATFKVEEFEKLVSHPKVVAIGECGLDFFHAKKMEDYDRQKELFLAQIHFALEHDKPLMIHAREAYEEILEILEPLKREHGEKLRGNIHFFAGNWVVAERFLHLGFTLSFTGVITFTRDYDEVIQKAPLASILSETDAPYVAPVPYRGKRNEPNYVSEVVRKIAEIRGEELGMVEKTLVNNALNMVG